MSQPVASKEVGATGLRCARCGAVVEGTRHGRATYTVGYYLLHTGKTVDATFVGRDGETPVAYRRLLEGVDVVSCPRCFAEPAVRRQWAAFGDEEASHA